MPAIYVKANLAWGRAIRVARVRVGLDQSDYGKAMGLPQQAISKLETGRRPLRAAEIPMAAKAARMTPQELFELFLSLYKI